MNFVINLILLSVMIGQISCSKPNSRQTFPGIQFLAKQEFFDLTVEPMKKLFVLALNKNKSKFTKDILISPLLNITNFHFSDLTLVEQNRAVVLQKDKNGIMLQPTPVKSFDIGIEWNLWFFGKNWFNGPIEYRVRNFTISSGFQLGATEDRGTPIINLYDFNIYEGDSVFYFGESQFAQTLATVFRYLLVPWRWELDNFEETFINEIVNRFLDTTFLRYGDIVIPIDFVGFGNLEYDLDIAMPQPPVVTDQSLQLYYNGGIYTMNENQYTNLPEQPLKFIDDENLGFQVAISEFIINQLLETLIQTNFTNIIPFDLIQDQIQFHIDSDMMEPLIPQLHDLFGKQNLTFMFQLKEGTNCTWAAKTQETHLNIKGTMRVLTDQKEQSPPVDFDDLVRVLPKNVDPTFDNFKNFWYNLFAYIFSFFGPVANYLHWLYLDPTSQAEAVDEKLIFVFDFDLETSSNFKINQETKEISINFSKLNLNDLTITDDLGTNIKNAEKDIKEGLQQIMGLVKVLTNKYLPKLNLKLPKWHYFNYDLQIEYQEKGIALGFGIKNILLENLLSDMEKNLGILNQILGNVKKN